MNDSSKHPPDERPRVPGWTIVVVIVLLASALGWFIAANATR
jgi:hypothetical protein